MTGDAALGNVNGIVLFASANTIGGTVAGAGNIIAGNDGTGYIFNGSQILIAGNPGLASDNNLIAGNYIGLDANGQALAGATGGGIVFDELTAGETTGNTIGGTTAGARNVISGNLGGIGLAGDNGNLVEGNYHRHRPDRNDRDRQRRLRRRRSQSRREQRHDRRHHRRRPKYHFWRRLSARRCGTGNQHDDRLRRRRQLHRHRHDGDEGPAELRRNRLRRGDQQQRHDRWGDSHARDGSRQPHRGQWKRHSFHRRIRPRCDRGQRDRPVSLPGGGTSPGNGNDGIDVISSSGSHPDRRYQPAR